MQREICLFRSWNTLPCAKNFKPKFEFQTLLARNSPVGTSELLPFGANSDIPWDWSSPEILLGDSSLLFPVGVYFVSNFLGNYIYFADPLCFETARTSRILVAIGPQDPTAFLTQPFWISVAPLIFVAKKN